MTANTPRPVSRIAALTALPLLCLGQPAAADTALPEVQVSAQGDASDDGSAAAAYRRDSVDLGPLGEGKPQDTPFSIHSVSADLIANTQATTTTEALKYVPTVYTNTGGSQITPYFSLRGFSASTWSYNMAVDGLRSFDIWEPLEDKAAIEVLNGAGGLFYGITSPAGMINYVSKRPSFTPSAEVTVGSVDQELYVQTALAGPLAGRQDLAYRLDLGYADAGETGTDDQTQGHYTFSGALDWRLGRDTLLTLDAAQARRKVDHPQALFVPSTASGIPDAPDATKNWGPADGHATDLTRHIGASLSSQLDAVFSVRAAARFSDDTRSYLMGRQYWKNADLDYTWRLDEQGEHHRRTSQYRLFLDAAFATGPVAHKLSLGGTWDDFTEGYDGYRKRLTTTVYAGNLDASDPVAPALTTVTQTASAQETYYTTWTIADQLSFGERWQLLLGGSQASIRDVELSRAASATTATRSDYAAERFTPALTLSYKPVPRLTTYVSYLESLQQGFTSTVAGNYGQHFAPYVGRQKEVGLKGRLGDMDLGLAWFRIDQANYMVQDDLASQDGKAVHKGWEFTLAGHLTANLLLGGGLTLLDASVDKAASNVGKTPQGAVERMAKLYAEYALAAVPGLTVTGGLSHTGKVPVDAANTLYVDAVTIADLGLRYRTRLGEHDTTLRAGISNLTGKDYWTTRSGMLYLGAPRTLSLSATMAF